MPLYIACKKALVQIFGRNFLRRSQFKQINKKEKLKELINSIINIFILISFYVMIAGFGAYLEQEINLNSFIGSSILAFLCVILFKTNIKGIVKINEILIPILIAVVLVIRNSKYSKYRYQHFEQPYRFTKK